MTDNRDEIPEWLRDEIDERGFGKVPLTNRRPNYLDGPEDKSWMEYQRRLDEWDEWYKEADIIDTPMGYTEPVEDAEMDVLLILFGGIVGMVVFGLIAWVIGVSQ